MALFPSSPWQPPASQEGASGRYSVLHILIILIAGGFHYGDVEVPPCHSTSTEIREQLARARYLPAMWVPRLELRWSVLTVRSLPTKLSQPPFSFCNPTGKLTLATHINTLIYTYWCYKKYAYGLCTSKHPRFIISVGILVCKSVRWKLKTLNMFIKLLLKYWKNWLSVQALYNLGSREKGALHVCSATHHVWFWT